MLLVVKLIFIIIVFVIIIKKTGDREMNNRKTNSLMAWQSEFNAKNRAKEAASNARQDARDRDNQHRTKIDSVIAFIDDNLNDVSLGLQPETKLLLKSIKSQLSQ